MIELGPNYNEHGWKSTHRRGSVIVNFKKELCFEFYIGVCADSGAFGKPFPDKPEEISHWSYFMWIPNKRSAECCGRFSSPEKAMIAGEQAAFKSLLKAIQQLFTERTNLCSTTHHLKKNLISYRTKTTKSISKSQRDQQIR